MEFVDVLNEAGEKTGEIKTRELVHKEGVWHATAHVWVLNNSGELLVQQRSCEKETFPGCWDISVAGHVSAGDEVGVTAVKELAEELGIVAKPEELEKIFVLPEEFTAEGRPTEREIATVFLLRSTVDVAQLRLQAAEVQAVRVVHWKKLQVEIQENQTMWVPHREQYERLWQHLEGIFLKNK